MGEVKTPGQLIWETLWSDAWPTQETRRKADYDAAAQAVLAADPVRTQALDLVESLADALGTHLTTRPDEDLIDEAREFVCKAREANKP